MTSNINTRTLKLKQLNGIQPSLMLLFTPFKGYIKMTQQLIDVKLVDRNETRVKLVTFDLFPSLF